MKTLWLKQIFSLSGITLISRVLGLVRDTLFFSIFGNSLIGAAFIIGFTTPNLFRRLLGEGALTSAFIPIFTKLFSRDKLKGFSLVNQVIGRLTLYFGSFLFFAIVFLGLTGEISTLPEQWQLSIPIIQTLLPYALLICGAAIFTAALQSIGKFTLPGLSPLLLNLSMIGTLIVGFHVLNRDLEVVSQFLIAGVLIGGILQIALPVWVLAQKGWNPRISGETGDSLHRVKTLFLSATLGAAVVQINVLITRLIAFQASDSAVNDLYLAGRLTEFPMGLFSIAIYTVLFPQLSRISKSSDQSEFSKLCAKGVFLTLWITLPSAAGLAILAEPITHLIFQWGSFTTENASQAARVLTIYATSIPAHSIVALQTRIFHAREEMKYPIIYSVIAMLLNITLCLLWAEKYEAIGLAWATVITAFSQVTLMAIHIEWRHKLRKSIKWSKISVIMLSSLSAVLLFSWYANEAFLRSQLTGSKVNLGLTLVLVITLAATGYALISWFGGVFKTILNNESTQK